MYHHFPDYSLFVSLLPLPVTVHLWNFCFGLFPVHQHFSQVLQRGNKIGELDKKDMPQFFDFRVVTDRAAHSENQFLLEAMPAVFNMGQILILIARLQQNHSGPLSGLMSNMYLFFGHNTEQRAASDNSNLKNGTRRTSCCRHVPLQWRLPTED